MRQHHRIIKTQKQDDPDYLTLFEAHQRRLEDTGSPTQGQGWCEKGVVLKGHQSSRLGMFCQLVFTYGLIVMGGQGKFAYRSSAERLVGSLTGEGWGGVVRKGYA